MWHLEWVRRKNKVQLTNRYGLPDIQKVFGCLQTLIALINSQLSLLA
jgi:hypothetical protein